MEHFLEQNRNKFPLIYCIGDSIIDKYCHGKVERISPEYPMSIINKLNDEVVKPGGCSNVAYQLSNFNCNVKLFSLLNEEAKKVCINHNINVDISIENDLIKIPTKTRYLHENNIPIIRIDDELKNFGLLQSEITRLIKSSLEKINEIPDVVILSDYNKGFFSNGDSLSIIEKFKDSITIVDPKDKPITKWKNCTVIKPNAKEAEQLSGSKDPFEQCWYFKSLLNCKGVVITQGGYGFVGLYDKTYFQYEDLDKINVESVVGAGDCFIAILALALSYKIEFKESCRIAFEAGKIYVQNRMNRPIVPAELSKNKIINPLDLKKRNFRLVFTNGCFDIVHSGHIKLLKDSKSFGDKVLVALNSDQSIKRLKGKDRPILPLEERMSIISNLDCVDFVTSFTEDDPIECIKKCKPEVLVKGGDYKLEDILGRQFVDEVKIISFLEGFSTTNIVNKIKNNYVNL